MGSMHSPDRDDLRRAATFKSKAPPADEFRNPLERGLIQRRQEQTPRLIPSIAAFTEPVAEVSFEEFGDERKKHEEAPTPRIFTLSSSRVEPEPLSRNTELVAQLTEELHALLLEKSDERDEYQIGIDAQLLAISIHELFTTDIPILVRELEAHGALVYKDITLDGKLLQTLEIPLRIRYGKRAAMLTINKLDDGTTAYVVKPDEGTLDREGHDHIIFNVSGPSEASSLYFALYGPEQDPSTLCMLIDTSVSTNLNPLHVFKMAQGAQILTEQLTATLNVVLASDVDQQAAIEEDSPTSPIFGSDMIHRQIDTALTGIETRTATDAQFNKEASEEQLKLLEGLLHAIEGYKVSAEYVRTDEGALCLSTVAGCVHMLKNLIPAALAELHRRGATVPDTIMYGGDLAGFTIEASRSGGDFFVIEVPQRELHSSSTIILASKCTDPHVQDGLYFAQDDVKSGKHTVIFDGSLAEVGASDPQKIHALGKTVFNLSQGICDLIFSHSPSRLS